MFIAFKLFGLEIVTRMILPSSSYSNLSVCNDITDGNIISMKKER
jgi:hypothetical protein